MLVTVTVQEGVRETLKSVTVTVQEGVWENPEACLSQLLCKKE